MAAFSLTHPSGAPAPRPSAKLPPGFPPPPGPSPARPRRGPGGGTGTPWPAQQSGRQSRRAGRSGATVQRPEGGGSLDLEGRRWRLRSGRDERGSDRGRGREGEGRGCRRPGLGERTEDGGGWVVGDREIETEEEREGGGCGTRGGEWIGGEAWIGEARVWVRG